MSELSNEVFIPLVIAGWVACAWVCIWIASAIWYHWDNVVTGLVLIFVGVFLLGTSVAHLPQLLEREDPTNMTNKEYYACLDAASTTTEIYTCRDEAMSH